MQECIDKQGWYHERFSRPQDLTGLGDGSFYFVQKFDKNRSVVGI